MNRPWKPLYFSENRRMQYNDDDDLRAPLTDEDYGPTLDPEHFDDGSAWNQFSTERAVKKCSAAMNISSSCESPIEVQLAAELIIYPPFSTGEALLLPQQRIEQYRYDFAVRLMGDDKPCIYIECDGLEFHSSPQQVANDRKKDAAVLAAGRQILRFTGSDIYRCPDGCAAKIRQAILFVKGK